MSVISVTTSGGTRRGPGGRIQHYASGVGWVESTVLGPLPCHGCGRTVEWVRASHRLALVEGREAHRCRVVA